MSRFLAIVTVLAACGGVPSPAAPDGPVDPVDNVRCSGLSMSYGFQIVLPVAFKFDAVRNIKFPAPEQGLAPGTYLVGVSWNIDWVDAAWVSFDGGDVLAAEYRSGAWITYPSATDLSELVDKNNEVPATVWARGHKPKGIIDEAVTVDVAECGE